VDILFPVLIAAGVMNVAAGIWFIRNVDRKLRDEVPAKVEVIDEKVEDGDNGKVYRPVYRVFDGPHAGLRHTSENAISPPIDRVGDIVEGIVSPKTGVVTSVSMRWRSHLFGRIFQAIGVGTILIGLTGLIV
jgi:hypothetical protein